MDRTLLKSGGAVSAYSAEVLAGLRAVGVKVVVATARGASGRAKLAGFDCYDALVQHNGARIEVAGQLFSGDVIRADEIAEVMARFTELGAVGARWALDDPTRPYDPAEPNDAYKLYIPLTERFPAEALLGALPGSMDAVIVDQGALAIMARAGVNKMTGIQKLLDHWGIDAKDAIAIGDDNNDLPMLEGCGLAVVMSNGTSSVLERFSEHAPRNDDDGVGRWLDAHRSLFCPEVEA